MSLEKVLYENLESEIEIVIEEDWVWDDYDDEIFLDEIPVDFSVGGPKNVDEPSENQNKSSDHSSKGNTSQIRTFFLCSKCNKKYVQKAFYDRHVNTNCNTTISKAKGSSKEQENKKEDEICRLLFTEKFKEAILLPSLKLVENDPVLNIQLPVETKANKVVVIARKVYEIIELNHAACDGALEQIREKFSEILFMKMGTSLGREKQCIELHKLNINADVKAAWFVEPLCLDPEHEATQLFFSCFFKKVFQQSLKWLANQKEKEDVKDLNLNFTTKECKVIRYVAGFIAFSIQKKLSRKKGKNSSEVFAILESWRASNESNQDVDLSENSTSWIERVNRGGLFLVNNQFYNFIRNIEAVVRTIFNTNLLRKNINEDLRDVLFKKLNSDDTVSSSWQILTREWSDYTSQIDILKYTIFRKWIDIRGRAFANVWMQKLRRAKSILSRKSESSLRKNLNKTQK